MRRSIPNTSTPYDDLPEWLTPADVAAYMSVSPWTVYEAIHSGELSYRRFGAKKIYIPKTEFHPDKARRENRDEVCVQAGLRHAAILAEPAKRAKGAKARPEPAAEAVP